MTLTKTAPTFQHHVLDAIINPMKEGEKRRLEKQLITLNKRNKEATSASCDGFLYNGTFFIPTTISTTVPMAGQRVPLVPSLWNEIEELILDTRTTELDLQFIQQVLFKVTEACGSWQDIRDALPDFLSDTMAETKSLKRIRPEAYTLLHDPRALRQYEKLKEKMAVYRMGRMMY